MVQVTLKNWPRGSHSTDTGAIKMSMEQYEMNGYNLEYPRHYKSNDV